MARYAIPSDKAFGVSVGALGQLAKGLGRNHDVALALWGSGAWSTRRDEFGRRAAFALLASLALHRRGRCGAIAQVLWTSGSVGGKDAHRELTSAAVVARLKARKT